VGSWIEAGIFSERGSAEGGSGVLQAMLALTHTIAPRNTNHLATSIFLIIVVSILKIEAFSKHPLSS
jgi:hypothetical protein